MASDDVTPTLLALERAARKVMAGLNARIEQADRGAVPVFDGIAELAAALNRLDSLRSEPTPCRKACGADTLPTTALEPAAPSTLAARSEPERRAHPADWSAFHEQVEAERRIAELERQIQGYQRECREVEQELGKALGYPWLADDQETFPGATEDDGVCVGEHVASTIAAEAAARLRKLLDKAEPPRAEERSHEG